MKGHSIMRMLLVFSISMGLSSVNYAQEKKTLAPMPKFYVGFLLSGSMSSLTRENALPFNIASSLSESKVPSIGSKIGLTGEYNFGRRMFLTTALSFVYDVHMRRWENVYGSHTDFKTTFSWFEVPLIINYSFVTKEKLSIFAGAGAAIRRLTASNRTWITPIGEVEQSMYSDTNEWNTFLNFQIGAQFYLPNGKKLQTVFSVQRSAGTIFKPPVPMFDVLPTEVFVPDFRLTTFNLGVQYALPIHRGN